MTVLPPDELEAALRAVGARRYHHLHPFHKRLHKGGCTRAQVQAWALNRYYYQSVIPLKDAALIARCPDPAVRRAWRSRLRDQDGDESGEGGLALWLKLTSWLGLDRAYVASTAGVLPGTRFAADAYVNFVREGSLLEAVASSLTEMFAPQIIAERLSGMLAHYDFVSAEALAYFQDRPPRAARDAAFALAYVKGEATTPETQRRAILALEFKCSVLWAMLDALDYAYVAPGVPPPGAFDAREHGA